MECSDIFLFLQLCADTFEICASMQQGTSVFRGLGWEVQSSWFKPQSGQNIDSVFHCLCPLSKEEVLGHLYSTIGRPWN